MVVNSEFWKDRRVLVTGHTGFKGSWLVAWLTQLGARVSGLSLQPAESPNLWSLMNLEDSVDTCFGDIRDRQAVKRSMQNEPEVVFHLAAQSLVRQSYIDPVETFSTNVIGTVELLQAIAQTRSVRSVVVVTSDKVYDNPEHGRAFVESDRLGGADPYSASKGACEIAAWSMYKSLFINGSRAGMATARAGNVIGGGDWARDRLIPDIVRGCLDGSGQVTLRAPESIRPWQHVLDPLCGYLKLAEKLYAEPEKYSRGFNFGPLIGDESDVQSVAEGMVAALGQGRIVHEYDANAPGESKVLRLDSSAAMNDLHWRPIWNFKEALSATAQWYAKWYSGDAMDTVTATQIQRYSQHAGVAVNET